MKFAKKCEEFEIKMGAEAIMDPESYTKLTDQVLQEIQFSKSTDSSIKKVCVLCVLIKGLLCLISVNIIKAQDILKNIEKRKLYKFIGYFTLSEKVDCFLSCL